MNKPTMKRELAVSCSYPSTGTIHFSATNDAASDVAQFGVLHSFGDGNYHLIVDPRYDFEEVEAWIRGYGEN